MLRPAESILVGMLVERGCVGVHTVPRPRWDQLLGRSWVTSDVPFMEQ